MMVLEIKNMVAGYGKLQVVQDVSVKLDKNEIVALLGPNGSGKSTLIKSIMGFAKVFSGSIIYRGEDITGMTSHTLCRMGIGYVPQINNIFPSLLVEENLEMGAYTLKDKSTLKSRIDEIYALFPELKMRKHEWAGNLSGGERQMLATARALVAGPKILFLDEPTASLSPKLASLLFNKVKEIRDSGVTILIAEQNVAKTLKIAERAYILVSGKCIKTAPSEELFSDKKFSKIYLGLRA